MQPWTTRVVEEANLFNPAFCSALLRRTVDEFQKKRQQPLPFALTFLILPIVLHRNTRLALPGSTVTSLVSWVQENREYLVQFALRVERLDGITREALLFGAQHQTLAITAEGALAGGARRQSITEKGTGLFTDEARDCVDRAGFLGRWFAVAGTTATIYAAWGVTP
jgi:hypothetical protein